MRLILRLAFCSFVTLSLRLSLLSLHSWNGENICGLLGGEGNRSVMSASSLHSRLQIKFHLRYNLTMRNGRKTDGAFCAGNLGRPKGARNKKTLALEALLDGEAEALTRTAIEKALDGDGLALRLCLERI